MKTWKKRARLNANASAADYGMPNRPTISVIVIAHDEEKYVSACLESLMRQTCTPEEYVFIAHNCSDRTEEIARTFPKVRVVHFDGMPGTASARMKGFSEARGEWLAWLDADSVAEPSWLAALTKPLADPSVAAVTNPALFHGNAFVWLASRFYFYAVHGFLEPGLSLCFRKVRRLTFWGTSFACRASDVADVGGIDPLIPILRPLSPSEWSEDFYLSLKLLKRGRIVLTKDTVVRSASKQHSSIASIRRFIAQQRNEQFIAEALIAPVTQASRPDSRQTVARPRR